MEEVNKYKDIIINHYSFDYDEDERFKKSRAIMLEYLTTMRYIEKFAFKGCKILEVGAGTGAYSVKLAQMGYDVTAIELVPSNLEKLRAKAKKAKVKINAMQGDALKLDMLSDNTFDIVLNLGPMYHLYNKADKLRAIKESIRVAKPNAYIFYAYLTHSSIVWGYGVRKNRMADLVYALNDDGSIRDEPKEIFSSFFVDEFKAQFKGTNTKYITQVATDGVANMMREYIDGDFSKENYDRLVKWHFATCERLDHQGLSSHMLYICQKRG